MAEPVVVTGLGLATSLGFGVAENWGRLLAGDSAIRALAPGEVLPPVRLPARLGAPVDREALAARIQRAVPRQVWRSGAEVCHLWLDVALEAMGAAGLWPPDRSGAAPDPARTGIYAGCGAGPVHFIEREFANLYTADNDFLRDVSRMGVPRYMASSLAGLLSLLTGCRGPSMTLNTACSSGAAALLTALDAIRLGRIDRAVAGGSEMPLGGTVLKGFANLGALSTANELGPRASRPLDADRDGFVLGEGAAALVIERASAARQRGATPLAVLRGGAMASEAHGLLSQKEDGSEIARCLALALDDAAVAPGAVAHAYLHGTGTPDNDRVEARALHDTLGPGSTVSVSKALLGHTIGAAAAIDSVLAVRTLATGRPVPVRHVERADPACGLRLAGEGDRLPGAAAEAVLVNAFAFGGHNAALLWSRPGEEAR